MRSFPVVYMRGGTSKGLIFLRADLPGRDEWDDIFLQCMGNPDPKQTDGMGGCVSSNNKLVTVGKSGESGVDVEYLVGQCVVGKNRIDYASNCGNMTAAVGPFAVDAGLVEKLTEPVTTVRTKNLNTDKYIRMTVPVKNGRFDNTGHCVIPGAENPCGELRVDFLDPGGSKTGKLFPTGRAADVFSVPGLGEVSATVIDVSNPLVLVRAKDVGASGTEMPGEADNNAELSQALEAIRAEACVRMGFATDRRDAAENSPAVPKVAFFAPPCTYKSLSGREVRAEDMDICVRVLSMFKCHKASPLTAAQAVACACLIPETVPGYLGTRAGGQVRIGHPGGVMTLLPSLTLPVTGDVNDTRLSSVSVVRTARKIMDGTIYIPD